MKPGSLTVWSLADGKVAHSLEGFESGVWGIAYSADGKYLAAAIGDYMARAKGKPGEVRVWEAATGHEVFTLRGHPSCVWSVAFSPDGRRLASCGGCRWSTDTPGEVKFWDMHTGQEVHSQEHDAPVMGIAFSPCGRRLATASQGEGGGVKIWDGTPLAETPAYRPLPDDN